MIAVGGAITQTAANEIAQVFEYNFSRDLPPYQLTVKAGALFEY